MRTTARLGTYIGGPIVIESRARVEIHEYERGWLIDGHRPGDPPHVRSSAKIHRCTDEGRCQGSDCKGHYTAVKRYAQEVALTYGPVSGEGESGRRIMPERCPFCEIVAGVTKPNRLRHHANVIDPRLTGELAETVSFEPLNPVTEGHLLVVPHVHLTDATASPLVTAEVMHHAARIAAECAPCNIITSCGAEATQTVMHLHVHVVPRREDDGLALPWTGQREQLDALEADDD
jgi:histidine triad (HIT) family protein